VRLQNTTHRYLECILPPVELEKDDRLDRGAAIKTSHLSTRTRAPQVGYGAHKRNQGTDQGRLQGVRDQLRRRWRMVRRMVRE
jgi:hypothetical protein